MSTRPITLDEILKKGLTYRQLDHWTRRGWLRPQHDGGTGNAPVCLRTARDGQPVHPLYQRGDLTPSSWHPPHRIPAPPRARTHD
jgi:hypothetical protein